MSRCAALAVAVALTVWVEGIEGAVAGGGWRPAPPPGHAGTGQAVLLSDGRLLRAESGGAELYDPDAGPQGAWMPTADPRTVGAAVAAIPLSGGPSECGSNCGKVLVRFGTGERADWKLYHPGPAGGSWLATGPPLFQRGFGATFTLLDGPNCAPSCGKVLAAGGFADLGPRGGAENPQSPLTAELYDPRTNAWAPTGRLAPGRVYHAAVVLRGPGCATSCGKVLVVGGGFRCVNFGPNGGPCAGADETAALYDPASGAWQSAPTPLYPHSRGPSATALADGRVLVVGGADGVPGHAEVFDPAAANGGGNWTPADGVCACAPFHKSVRLPDGRVLVVGGENSASAEIYDPRSNAWTPADTSPAILDSMTVLGGSKCGAHHGDVLAVGPEVAQFFVPSGKAPAEACPSGRLTGAGGVSGTRGSSSALVLILVLSLTGAAVPVVGIVMRRRRRPAPQDG